MTDAAANADRPYPSAKLGWYAVFVLLVAYTLSFIDRQILTLLVIPIQQDLKVNDTQIGILHGFTFAIFYGLLGLPIARLVDRGNRKVIISIGIALWSFATAFCGFSIRYAQLLLARIGVAVGEATLLPGASSIVADYFPPKKRALAMGIFASGLYIGGGLALIAGGLLIQALEPVDITLPFIGKAATWQLVFIVVGFPGLLVALLALTMREPERRQRGTSEEDPGLPISDVMDYAKAHSRAYTYFILAAGLAVLVGQASALWGPTFFVREHGWTYTEYGIRFGMVILVVGPVGAIFGGWLADYWVNQGKIDGKVRIGILSSLGLIGPAIAFPLVPNAWIALALAVVSAFFASTVWGAAPAAVQDMTPGPMRGQMTAVYTGAINLIGIGLGPASVGVLTDYVFGDVAMMKYSLVIIGSIGTVLSGLFFWLALKPFRGAAVAAEAWR